MGTSSSHLSSLGKNEQLARFVSIEPISPIHPFWNGFLSYRQSILPFTREDYVNLETIVEELSKRFLINNLKTGNFGSLIDVFLSRIDELEGSYESKNSIFYWQTQNALFIIRIVLQFFIERLSEEELFFHLVKESPSFPIEDRTNSPEKRPEQLLNGLLDIILHLPLTDLTYSLHLENTRTLLILLSFPLYSSNPTLISRFMKMILFNKCKSKDLLKVLLQFYMEQTTVNLRDRGDSGSLVLGLASSLWSLLTYGIGVNTSIPKGSPPSNTPLADLSLILILIFTNTCMEEIGRPILENPFKRALLNLRDLKDESSVSDDSIKIDFSKLFKIISTSLDSDESTILFYMLLHQNTAFPKYVFASTDMELYVIPILNSLYNAPKGQSHHVYMSIILLLLLSEDDVFNGALHSIHVKNVEWYKERSLAQSSLGGILILVVLRTIQYNMLKMRDKYLHTNCLAALANMSSQFRNLHPYVCQRMISMLEVLSKKHKSLVNTLHQSEDDGEEYDEDLPISEVLTDAKVLEEVLRMMLEILNSCLAHQIKDNGDLIYTLLIKREFFESLASTNSSFQDLLQNIQTVITYFNNKLEIVQTKNESPLSVMNVHEIIHQSVITFPKEKLMKFPDLKFKYVEEEKPEFFFVPYIWNLATRHVYWNSQHFKLIVN